MNLLLKEPTADQRAVLSILHGELERNARWPIWQFIDLQLKPQGAAARALTSMPRVRDTRQAIGMTYGWVWWENLYGTPSPGVKIELTVAGLWALRYDDLPKLYLRLLQYCIEEQGKLVPSPTEQVQAVLDSDQIRDALLPEPPADGQMGDLAEARAARHSQLAKLRLLLEHEPPTMMRVSGSAGSRMGAGA